VKTTRHLLATGLEFPEGPTHLGAERVAFVEIRGGRVSLYDHGSVQAIAATGGGPNGATRGPDGALRVIPNGQLTEFSTYSAGGVRAVVDVPVARDVPVDRTLALLGEVGAAWARESGVALDRPEPQGIIGWSGGDVVLRLTARVPPERRLAAEAELRRRIKEAFDRQHWSPIGTTG